jgi:hypothetical protein
VSAEPLSFGMFEMLREPSVCFGIMSSDRVESHECGNQDIRYIGKSVKRVFMVNGESVLISLTLQMA